MKYLNPIFDSKEEDKEYLLKLVNSLLEKTNALEVIEGLNDYINDIKDIITVTQTDDSSELELRYKNTVNRTDTLSLDRYLNLDRVTNFSHLLRSLKSFLSKSELGVKMDLVYKYTLDTFYSDNMDPIINELQSILNQCDSNDIKLLIGAYGDSVYFDFEKWKEYIYVQINSFLSYVGNEKERLKEETLNISLKFTIPIDIEKFKIEVDTKDIPSNIIDDFNAFSKRYNIVPSDRIELINIIKRGDWSGKINESISDKDKKEIIRGINDILLDTDIKPTCQFQDTYDQGIFLKRNGKLVVYLTTPEFHGGFNPYNIKEEIIQIVEYMKSNDFNVLKSEYRDSNRGDWVTFCRKGDNFIDSTSELTEYLNVGSLGIIFFTR